jgi:hypothetical protein
MLYSHNAHIDEQSANAVHAELLYEVLCLPQTVCVHGGPVLERLDQPVVTLVQLC